MGEPKISDHIQINVRMQNPSQEPPESSKNRNMGVSKSSENIQIKIKIPNPSQEPPASFKASNDNLNDMDVLCTKIKTHDRNIQHTQKFRSGL